MLQNLSQRVLCFVNLRSEGRGQAPQKSIKSLSYYLLTIPSRTPYPSDESFPLKYAAPVIHCCGLLTPVNPMDPNSWFGNICCALSEISFLVPSLGQCSFESIDVQGGVFCFLFFFLSLSCISNLSSSPSPHAYLHLLFWHSLMLPFHCGIQLWAVVAEHGTEVKPLMGCTSNNFYNVATLWALDVLLHYAFSKLCSLFLAGPGTEFNASCLLS